MSEKKNGNSGGFLTKTGMTVIVLLLVCVIGMSYSIFRAYRAVQDIDMVSFNKDAWEESVEEAEESLPASPPILEDTEPEEPDDYIAAEIYELEDFADEEPPADIETIPVFNDEKSGLSMTLPFTGQITCDYSADELLYSETFDDWRVHLGIDIAAEIGTPVAAAAAGVVERVYTDEDYGLTAVIRHTSYICTLYAGLDRCDVTEGDAIMQGETVGASGNSAVFESAQPPHIHFEVLRDGVSTDPYEYLTIDE